MPYRAPTAEYTFIFDHVVNYAQVHQTDLFAEATPDVAEAIVGEAARMADAVLAPLNTVGDLEGTKLVNGTVHCAPGFKEAMAQMCEGGWIGSSAAQEYGGMGLPLALSTAVSDMIAGACLAIQVNTLLCQGQIEALEHHAPEDIKAQYLPKLVSGAWAGTMNLTEPAAGSDVGALTTKAVANGDGTYAISGQKIFISWGDNDYSENVSHLVLARLPDGKPGPKGISLFLVPKFLPDADGTLGARNGVRVVSLEHKMGLHASPTAVMEYDNATGWLIGKEHDGMAAMFTMMNNARLGVAAQGVGVAEVAYQKALAYALDRKQGRSPIADGTGTIVDHADVRRMLTTMKAEIFAARAITLSLAVAIDMQSATGDPDHAARAALLTPIAKSYGSDIGNEVAAMGVQVHGGMGFIEEAGAAQFVRDARITTIWEGTNGIQAMDLVARKMMDGGEAAFRLIEEIEKGAEAARGTLPDMAGGVWAAAETLREGTEFLLGQDMNDRFAGAVPYQRAFARVLGAHFHLRAAIAEGGRGKRTDLARFYIKRLLPEYAALLAHAGEGAAGLYALSAEDLGAA